MIFMGFDPPKVEPYSKRAHRRLETLQDITIEEDNIQDEDEGEDEPLDETFAQEEACEPEEVARSSSIGGVLQHAISTYYGYS
ncbi:hypothetical protein R1flu_012670 [Riccia fluitans]|uniref:Uncharacterized protein n=1 Tax=Riccia fluitans TaxID=41844 RepID=A0ABD1ZBI2_9MARC